MNTGEKWLAAHGDGWRVAVEEAAGRLLSAYRPSLPEEIPLNIYRLAYDLDTKIEFHSEMEGEARLLPIHGGFLILADERIKGRNYKRFRTSVAHELAHTLFYERGAPVPKRGAPATAREEQFCFDVARRVLAPRAHVRGIVGQPPYNLEQVFSGLTVELQLSRPVAARAMLEDHRAASGIAGYWTPKSGSWEPKRGQVYASPDLTSEERKRLRSLVKRFLERGRDVPLPWKLVKFVEGEDESVFVVLGREAYNPAPHGLSGGGLHRAVESEEGDPARVVQIA